MKLEYKWYKICEIKPPGNVYEQGMYLFYNCERAIISYWNFLSNKLYTHWSPLPYPQDSLLFQWRRFTYNRTLYDYKNRVLVKWNKNVPKKEGTYLTCMLFKDRYSLDINYFKNDEWWLFPVEPFELFWLFLPSK